MLDARDAIIGYLLIGEILDLAVIEFGRLSLSLEAVPPPDVILMNINLPGITCIEAMKILRLDPLTTHILIVALSANAMSRDIKKGLEAGFFRYLTK